MLLTSATAFLHPQQSNRSEGAKQTAATKPPGVVYRAWILAGLISKVNIVPMKTWGASACDT